MIYYTPPPHRTNVRINNFDIVKGIGILLVVFAHVNYINPPQNFIYAFHMPLFFIISGMLFNSAKYKSFRFFLRKRLETLICPYLLFSFFSFLLCIITTIYPDGFSKENILTALRSFLQIFIAQDSQHVYNTPLWFVPCLFVVECLCFFLLRIGNKILFYASSVAIVSFGWFTQSELCPINFSFLPWNLGIACFACGFYLIGNKVMPFTKQFLLFPSKMKKLLGSFIFVFSMISVFFISKYNGHISMGSRHLSNGLLLYLSGIIGTIGIICISPVLTKCKFLSICGRNSFYIMATHKMIETIFCLILKYILHSEYEYTGYIWIDSIIMFFAVTIFSVLFSLFYQKIKEQIKGAKTNG